MPGVRVEKALPRVSVLGCRRVQVPAIWQIGRASSCERVQGAGVAGRAASDADYERLGLSRDTVAAWEDGARTDGGRGSFEW